MQAFIKRRCLVHSPCSQSCIKENHLNQQPQEFRNIDSIREQLNEKNRERQKGQYFNLELINQIKKCLDLNEIPTVLQLSKIVNSPKNLQQQLNDVIQFYDDHLQQIGSLFEQLNSETVGQSIQVKLNLIQSDGQQKIIRVKLGNNQTIIRFYHSRTQNWKNIDFKLQVELFTYSYLNISSMFVIKLLKLFG